MRLREDEKAVLAALVRGSRLRSHRHLDGTKLYRLHRLEDDAGEEVTVAVVKRLRDLGLIAGNMKFPAATYLLTAKGERVAASLTTSPLHPILARLFPDR
jgi:hypothetical protein